MLRLFFIVLLSTTISCNDDDYPHKDIPSVVVNGFWTEFHRARDVDFEKSGENYEVEFEIDGNDHKAIITSQGKLLSEKQEVSYKSLPAQIQTSLARFGKNIIRDPEMVKKGEVKYYQARLKRFLMDKKIVLDESGKENHSIKFWD